MSLVVFTLISFSLLVNVFGATKSNSSVKIKSCEAILKSAETYHSTQMFYLELKLLINKLSSMDIETNSLNSKENHIIIDRFIKENLISDVNELTSFLEKNKNKLISDYEVTMGNYMLTHELVTEVISKGLNKNYIEPSKTLSSAELDQISKNAEASAARVEEIMNSVLKAKTPLIARNLSNNSELVDRFYKKLNKLILEYYDSYIDLAKLISGSKGIKQARLTQSELKYLIDEAAMMTELTESNPRLIDVVLTLNKVLSPELKAKADGLLNILTALVDIKIEDLSDLNRAGTHEKKMDELAEAKVIAYIESIRKETYTPSKFTDYNLNQQQAENLSKFFMIYSTKMGGPESFNSAILHPELKIKISENIQKYLVKFEVKNSDKEVDIYSLVFQILKHKDNSKEIKNAEEILNYVLINENVQKTLN